MIEQIIPEVIKIRQASEYMLGSVFSIVMRCLVHKDTIYEFFDKILFLSMRVIFIMFA